VEARQSAAVVAGIAAVFTKATPGERNLTHV
jgi:hypothetical protein